MGRAVATWVFASASLFGCVADVDGTAAIDDVAAKRAGVDPNTYFSAGPPKGTDPFFASLGTNGRSCAACHVASEGWAITPAEMQARFDAAGGPDPVFRTNDGSVSPTADVSTVNARRSAYKMLLPRGVIRVGLPIPATAEFTLASVDDPYHHASASELSLFRRPLPSTNLAFLSAIMWDGREASLGSQAIDATLGHAKATDTVQSQMDSIVAFESSIFTAEASVAGIGPTNSFGATGGPQALASTPFYIGINDPIGMNPMNTPFDPSAMKMFDAWTTNPGTGTAGTNRAAIARGEVVFNTHRIAITGVKGLNDKLGVTTIQGTCTTCPGTPPVGAHSVAMALDLGLSDASRRTPDMPLYTLKNNANSETIQATEP